MTHPLCFAVGFVAGLAVTVSTVLIVELLEYWDLLTFL
jgi:hypothetical protein